MVRPIRRGSEGFSQRPKKSGALSVVAGVAAFALLAGATWLVIQRESAAGRNADSTGTVAVADSQPVVPAAGLAASKVSAVEAVAANPAPAAGAAPAKPAEASPLDPKAEIAGRLEAGEFGPVLDLALAAEDPAERNELLKLVAAAQIKAGDVEGARSTIRRIPDSAERVRLQGDAAAESLAGGGSMANFGPLIELLENETSGPWESRDGAGGRINQFDTGVRVEPNGLLAMVSKEEREGRLAALGVRARKADLNRDMAQSSDLRLVSLTRLEKEVARRLEAGEPVLETMQHFAGLSQIRYVFVTPAGEVIVGGPAEAWRYDENGLPVGVESGRPTLQLDDFVTVLRAFHDGGLGMFQCLIVPRQEGLKNLKTFVEASNAKGPLSAGGVKNWANQLQQKLGLQDVEINGVPADSRVARVIVEADYRMKLIGVDKLDAGKDIPSYFDLAGGDAKGGQLDALRWWLTMKYDAVLHSPERQVFEIQGAAVKCLSENELITKDGERVATGKAEATNRLFAQSFTSGYEKLAERDIVFADLQNIFDLSLVSALLAKEKQENGLAWDLGTFTRDGLYEPARYATPKTVMSVVNYRVYGGKDIVVQVAGGVRADLMTVVENKSIVREQPRLTNLASKAQAPQLPEGRWWWDAAAE